MSILRRGSVLTSLHVTDQLSSTLRAPEAREPPSQPHSASRRSAAKIALRAYRSGVAFEVRTTGDLASRVADVLPPGSHFGDGLETDHRYSLEKRHGEYRVSVDSEERTRHPNLEHTLAQLEDLVRFDVARSSREHLFVHAGVVAMDNQAVIIPGSSGAGKSHLVAALVRAGARYYSDEFALIDSNGRVHPYAQKMALASLPGGPKRRVSAEKMGGSIGTEPLPVGLVLIARYRKGATYQPELLSPAQTVLELLAHVVRARSAPREALERLEKVALGARAVGSDRGDADQLARHLLANSKLATDQQGECL